LNALTATLFVFFLYAVVIFVAYGRVPHLERLFSSLQIASLGCFTLPMPLLHPWNFLILPYLVGLWLGVRSVLTRRFSPKVALIVYCSMWGCATFGYYLGRSHNMNLIPVSKESIFLIILFADQCREETRSGKTSLLRLPHWYLFLLFFLYALPVGLLQMPSALSRLRYDLGARLADSNDVSNRVAQNIVFIEKHTQPGERVLIFSESNGAYYAETKTQPGMNVLLLDMFWKEQWREMQVALDQANPPKIFWEITGFYYQKTELQTRLDNKTLMVLDKNPYMQLLGPANAKNSEPSLDKKKTNPLP
jgi:hypothetical protein